MIPSLRAAGRLAWRPATLANLYVLAMALAAPALILEMRLGEGSDAMQPQYMHTLVWGQVFLLLPTLGAVSSQILAPALTQPLVLTTPGMRMRLLHTRLALGVAVAILVAFLLASIGRPQDSIPALFLSLFFFELGVLTSDGTSPRLARWVIPFLIIAAMSFLPRAVSLVETNAWLLSIPALAAAAVLITADLSRERARQRIANVRVTVGYQFGFPVIRSVKFDDREFASFKGNPGSGRLIDLVRAIDYEGSGVRRFGTVADLGLTVLFFSAFSYAFSNPGLPALFGVMFLATGRGFLASLPYPLSREQRARAVFTNGVARYASYYGAAALTMWILGHSGLPRIWYFPRDHDVFGVNAIVGTLLWMPLAFWLGVKLKLDRLSAGPNQGKWFIVLFVTLILSIPTAAALPEIHGGFPVQAMVLGVLLAGGHYLLWLGLKRHFASADLV